MTRSASWRCLPAVLAAMAAAAFGAARAQAQPADQTVLTPAELVARLDILTDALERSPLPASADIPPTWRVSADGRSFEISAQPLRAMIDAARANPQDGSPLERAAGWVSLLRSEVEAYAGPAPVLTAERGVLDAVLAEREFNAVERPGPFDALRDRVVRWLADLFSGLVGSSSVPTIRDALVYVLIAAAVAGLAFWFYRSLRRAVALETIGAAPPVMIREWRTWWTDAQDAAANGRWRDAVHAAYWCGISFLESRGAWRADHARTPREYLRLMSGDREATAPLTTLTAEFERVWYGQRPADASTFTKTRDALQKLGCPPS